MRNVSKHCSRLFGLSHSKVISTAANLSNMHPSDLFLAKGSSCLSIFSFSLRLININDIHEIFHLELFPKCRKNNKNSSLTSLWFLQIKINDANPREYFKKMSFGTEKICNLNFIDFFANLLAVLLYTMKLNDSLFISEKAFKNP